MAFCQLMDAICQIGLEDGPRSPFGRSRDPGSFLFLVGLRKTVGLISGTPASEQKFRYADTDSESILMGV